MKCVACINGCDICDLKNTTKCFKCISPLLLYIDTCVGTCPVGYRADFTATKCEPSN